MGSPGAAAVSVCLTNSEKCISVEASCLPQVHMYTKLIGRSTGFFDPFPWAAANSAVQLATFAIDQIIASVVVAALASLEGVTGAEAGSHQDVVVALLAR